MSGPGTRLKTKRLPSGLHVCLDRLATHRLRCNHPALGCNVLSKLQTITHWLKVSLAMKFVHSIDTTVTFQGSCDLIRRSYCTCSLHKLYSQGQPTEYLHTSQVSTSRCHCVLLH